MSKQGLLSALSPGMSALAGGMGGKDGEGDGFSPLMFLSPFLGATKSAGMSPFASLFGLPGLFHAYKHRDKNHNSEENGQG